jgi:PAS domain S-box-containing protein
MFVGIIRDIGEHHKLSESISSQRDLYETIIRHMPDVVFRLDLSFRYLFVGGAVHAISSVRAEDWIGKSARELGFTDTDCDRLEEACRGVVATARPVDVELRSRGVWLHHRLIPEFDAQGQVTTILGVTEDVTERKALESELTKHRDNLEHLIEQRTDELRESHDQIRMADRMASIGTLAAGLGHDMNNVLLPIRAFLVAADAAAGSKSGPEFHSAMQQITRSVDYLQQLADGLHYLASNPDTEESEESTTDLLHWWAETGPLLSQAIPAHIRVDVDLSGLSPQGTSRKSPRSRLASIAPHQLTQAVLNLLTNAVAAFPEAKQLSADPPTIRLVARYEGILANGGSQRRLLVSVSDNGAGMTPDVKRRAFEMFFTTRPRGMGTGLGLPLVARVVRNAGGRVDVESSLGKGTTVTLELQSSGRPQEQRPTAAILLPDSRPATMLAHLLEAAGIDVLRGTVFESATILIVEPNHTTIGQARSWLCAEHVGNEPLTKRRLVIVGEPVPSTQLEWAGLHPHHRRLTDDFLSLRSLVAELARNCHISET